jgi:Na+/H+ antiporter NhaD/arsenite permease-like protein
MAIALVAIFLVGYLFITLEHQIHLDKAASALLTGMLCWTVYAMSQHGGAHELEHAITTHVGEIASILFFLLGAMTIVELMDSHRAFELIARAVNVKSKLTFTFQIAFLTFFLSAVLDNLTTAIIMVTMLRKIVADKNLRLTIIGIVVIAANSGGAWTPIGDVTTTMLWVGKQVSTVAIITTLFLPALVSVLVPLFIMSPSLKGPFQVLGTGVEDPDFIDGISLQEQRLMLFAGLSALVFVPIFKSVTHLPPFYGMMIGLSALWILTVFINRNKEAEAARSTSVYHALERIDTPTILFFLGILLAVASLQEAGLLVSAAGWLDRTIGNQSVVVMLIGILSSIIDNVPLVAAAQKMYTLEQYPTDSFLWEFLAYCAGTGGSILIIGSAAGVAAMGLEKISFFWYVKKISLLALCKLWMKSSKCTNS